MCSLELGHKTAHSKDKERDKERESSERDADRGKERADVAFGLKLLNHHVSSHYFLTSGALSTFSGATHRNSVMMKGREPGSKEERGGEKHTKRGRDKQERASHRRPKKIMEIPRLSHIDDRKGRMKTDLYLSLSSPMCRCNLEKPWRTPSIPSPANMSVLHKDYMRLLEHTHAHSHSELPAKEIFTLSSYGLFCWTPIVVSFCGTVRVSRHIRTVDI